MATVNEVIVSVCEYIEAEAEKTGNTIIETRDAMHAGEYGDKGRLAWEVWYAWQYDGIDGGCADRWQRLAGMITA